MFLNYAAHAGIVAKNFVFSILSSCQVTGWKQKQISSEPLSFRSIDMSDGGKYQTFMAASGGTTYPFISSDYGETWKQITGNTSILPYWHDTVGTVTKIFKNGATQMFVGPRSGPNTGPYLFNISYDYGNTWEILRSGNNATMRQFDASDDYKVMASVGLIFDNQLSVTHDSGVTWFEPTNSPISDPGDTFAWGDISMSSDGKYILTNEPTANSNVYLSNDSGASWDIVSLPANITWVKPKVSKNGDIQFIAANNAADLYRSADYGNSWTKVLDRDTTDTWQSIDISKNNKYVLATTNAGPMYRSKNSGVTWEEIDLSKYGTPSLGGVAISLNGKYQTSILKSVGTSGNSIYTNCNFGLDPGQIAEVECYEGLSNYSIEALYIHDHNPNSALPDSKSLCAPITDVIGDNSITILTPYSPSNYIPISGLDELYYDFPGFTGRVVLPSVQESVIEVNVQTVLKPGGSPLIDISYDGVTFGQSTVVPIPGINDPGEIFLEASVPSDLSYDTSLTLLTLYAGGGGNGESAPCGGPGHTCNRATFDIIIGTGIDPVTSGVIGVTVLNANLNNGGGPTDPGPGPFPYDGTYDRYSSGIITPEMSEQIFGPSHNDGLEKSYFVQIKPSENNTNPHNGVTNIRIRDCSGTLVYNCCLGIGGGTNIIFDLPGDGSSVSPQALGGSPEHLIEILNNVE